MKYLLLITLFMSALFATDNEKQKITLGLGPYYQSQPYKRVDDILLPSPVIFYDNEIFYIRWSRYGIYFLGNKGEDLSWGLSLTVQPRVYGYEKNDILGMDARKNSLEGGIALSVKKDDTHFEAILMSDPIYKNNAWIVQAEFGIDFKYKKLSFYPSIMATYQSSDFTNYYYGITQIEATRRASSTYTPGSGIQTTVQTYIEYPINDKLSTLINIRADRLSSSASKSPLLNEKQIYSGLASFIYTFEY